MLSIFLYIFPPKKFYIVVATERSQLSLIEISMNAPASECDSAGFFQWQQLYIFLYANSLLFGREFLHS